MKTHKQFKRADVEVIARQRAYNGFYQLDVYDLKHALFNGGFTPEIKREVIDNRDAVGVLLFDPKLNCIALVEQFRIGAYVAGEQNPWLLEVVAGLVEEGEEPQQVALRESLEEANCEVGELELIAEYYSSPGSTTQKFILYCGFCDLSQAGGIHGLPEEAEDIRVHAFNYPQVLEMLAAQTISNANTLVALQWLQLNHQRLISK